MAKKSLDQKIYEDCYVEKNVVFNSEKEYVKHIIWKDFECVKAEVSRVVDNLELFNPAGLISYVHFSLEDIADFAKRVKK